MFKIDGNLIEDDEGYTVAEVWNSGNNKELLALFAAAPQMLTALKSCAEMIGALGPVDKRFNEMTEVLDIIIAKAEGRK